jgi:hypothetical protein
MKISSGVQPTLRGPGAESMCQTGWIMGRQSLSCLSGTDVKDAKVISVSTGTKCINGEYMSDRGLALNDCHAEIISRRSLLRFLYAQLELYLK